MAHIWKVEFHCIGADDEVFAYHESLEEAQAEQSSCPGMTRIEQVTYYLNERETVWERAA